MPDEPGKRASRRRAAIIVGAMLLAWLVVVGLYLTTPDSGDLNLDHAEPPKGGVLVALELRSFDAQRSEFSTLLTVAEDPTWTRTEDLRVFVTPVSGAQSVTFKAGEPPGINAVTLFAADGDIETWPFDRHRAEFAVVAIVGSQAVPVTLSVTNSVSGWRVTSREVEPDASVDATMSTGAERAVDVDLTRTYAVLVLAGALLLVLVTLPVLALVLVRRAVRTGRKPEAGLFGWLSGMLFATVPIRNFFPGSPPPGSAVDVLIVVWVVVALVVALGLLVRYWMTTPNP